MNPIEDAGNASMARMTKVWHEDCSDRPRSSHRLKYSGDELVRPDVLRFVGEHHPRCRCECCAAQAGQNTLGVTAGYCGGPHQTSVCGRKETTTRLSSHPETHRSGAIVALRRQRTCASLQEQQYGVAAGLARIVVQQKLSQYTELPAPCSCSCSCSC